MMILQHHPHRRYQPMTMPLHRPLLQGCRLVLEGLEGCRALQLLQATALSPQL